MNQNVKYSEAYYRQDYITGGSSMCIINYGYRIMQVNVASTLPVNVCVSVSECV